MLDLSRVFYLDFGINLKCYYFKLKWINIKVDKVDFEI